MDEERFCCDRLRVSGWSKDLMMYLQVGEKEEMVLSIGVVLLAIEASSCLSACYPLEGLSLLSSVLDHASRHSLVHLACRTQCGANFHSPHLSDVPF